jgi:hypothetical protein
MPELQVLDDAWDIIEAVGDIRAVMAMTGASYKVVCHWGQINQFPAKTYCILQVALNRHGGYAGPHLWGMTGFQKSQERHLRPPLESPAV